MNSRSTRVQLRPQLKRTIQNQIQKQSQSNYSNSVSDETGRGASSGLDFSELMGVVRSTLGPTEMARNGSILKRMLKQGGCREIEAAIRGLPLVIPGCRDLRPLWTAKKRDGRRVAEDIYGQAVQAYYSSVKEQPKPKTQSVWTPTETKEPQRLDFSKWVAA